MKTLIIAAWCAFGALLIGVQAASAQCPAEGAFCDSATSNTDGLIVCPEGDIVWIAYIKDSCGNPICEPDSVWLQFGSCFDTPCLDEHPFWPRVHPDSCDPTTGAHYFSVKASQPACGDCPVFGVINGFLCGTLPVRYLDTDGSGDVTASDFHADNVCSDYTLDEVVDLADLAIHNLHFGHACSGQPPACCVGVRGNVDGDAGEIVDVGDANELIFFLFLGGPAPTCPDEGNVDGDAGNIIDVGDITYLIDYLFLGGPLPPACP